MLFQPNLLVQYLQKPAAEFTRDDIIRYIEEREIQLLNFRYVGEDGKLKTINFMVNGRKDLELVLSFGERVDGSSIFPYLEPNSSDLYLVPRYKTAFLNPFSKIPAVDILCSFYGADGQPLESSPEYILRKAQRRFFNTTGMQVKMMAELKYYVISNTSREGFDSENGYHCAEPFSENEQLRIEALMLIARCGGRVRFGHTETGRFTRDGKMHEQHELEFSPVDPDDASDQLVIAKWILRMLGQKFGVSVTFIPKIALSEPGSGMHVHFLTEQNGRNALVENGELTSASLKMIAGILDLSPALTAFANTNPVSYLRLMPGEKAAQHIGWGFSNRSSLVRVPLVFNEPKALAAHANQQKENKLPDNSSRQTIEYRGSDGSANPYLFSAALIVAMLHGFSDSGALKKAGEYQTDENWFASGEDQGLDSSQRLPVSCYESAGALENARDLFESDQIFPKSIINHILLKLRSFNDKDWCDHFRTSGENRDFRKLVDKYLNDM